MDKTIEVGVKLHLNGFPKSGLHALNSMVVRLVVKAQHNNWLGSFDGHAFRNEWYGVEEVIERINNIPDKAFIKGHMGYKPEIAQAFKDNNVVNVFIFRDFRDVAVSAAYHVTSGKDNWHYPDKERMTDMSFDDALEIIIAGNEHYDPLMERWEDYAPWLEEEGVMRVCYGDLITQPRAWAELLIRYIYGKSASFYGLQVELDRETFDSTVELAMKGLHDRDTSPTYRKGKLDKWKEHFTPEQKELFKQTDKNNWLIKLGFEEDNDW